MGLSRAPESAGGVLTREGLSISRRLRVKPRKQDDCSSGKLPASIEFVVRAIADDQLHMTADARALPRSDGFTRVVSLLLNIGHGIDHMFLLIFATAVASIAVDFGYTNWEDLMPYAVGAFALFGLGSLPAGRLGDLWGRRIMMIVFFVGLGVASILTAMTQNAWQLALGLALIGVFASIYHPVGIPMVVENVPNPGAVIGLNGLAGNLGIAVAALVTGLLVKWIGWRAAFIVPGIFSIACGIVFAIVCPKETEAPSKRKGGKAAVTMTPSMLARAF